jgi:hypothetical protein
LIFFTAENAEIAEAEIIFSAFSAPSAVIFIKIAG